MTLAKVLGNVVNSVKHPGFDGHKLMIVQPLDDRSAPIGASFLAVDTVQAGPGDIVLVNAEGNGTRQILGGQPPIRSLIVAIVDAVELS